MKFKILDDKNDKSVGKVKTAQFSIIFPFSKLIYKRLTINSLSIYENNEIN
jgi:hypothetical protein